MASKRSVVRNQDEFRLICHFFALILVLSMPAVAHADEKFPAIWRKSMTKDPATNIYLNKYSHSLSSSAAEMLRNVRLSILLGNGCEGASVNKKAGTTYLNGSGYFALKGQAWDDAAFTADNEFRYFDYRALAHLCAGIDYLFGAKGKLIQNAVSPGAGEPKYTYDPANPFVGVPVLPKPEG